MNIRDDKEQQREAEVALGLRDAPETLDDRQRDEKGRFTREGDSPDAPEVSADDANPSAQEEPPAADEAHPEPPPEAGAPEPRKYAGKYDTVEDLEKAYQESLTLAGRHGQELGELRREAEMRKAREAEELRQRQQSDEEAKLQAWNTLARTPYHRLTAEQQAFLDQYAEQQYGVDGLTGQVYLRQDLLELQQQQRERKQAEAYEAEVEHARVVNLGSSVRTWVESQPDVAQVGPLVWEELQRRKHLFNVPKGTSPEDEQKHYIEVFEDLFHKHRGRLQKAEATRQKELVAEHRQQQETAFEARKRGAGEAANAPAPRAPHPSAPPPKSKGPVDEFLEEHKGKRSLLNLVNGRI